MLALRGLEFPPPKGKVARSNRAGVAIPRLIAIAIAIAAFPGFFGAAPHPGASPMNPLMYDASISVFNRSLTALSAILDKAAAHAAAKGFDPAILLNDRLAPDMFT